MIHQKYNCVQKTIVLFLIIIFSSISGIVYAQENFADKCVGEWEGIMYIYGKGQLRDSVPVRLIVQKTNRANAWIWKTNYLSKTAPVEKNYTFLLKDASTQTYLTDEGDGVEIMNYYFNNKLYSVFETHDVLLTSSYELQNNQLIFEVTSGKKIEHKKEVTNYSVLNLQRVVFKKAK